ncbi:type III-B CRISPR module-associated Cmr3 family protein [Vibrio cincinnatiensis]|uniref:type III-B CRISPR module-associated Cmr3 family protein n=1 Tax=Vibrio cincinnatiensis TaxID=675 RepID=UPI001EDEA85E|nr:type III-B CRISPR module-associated Cmr3 family protein [Vibrio cincinnatiensis]MCG3733754.1 hypothetical protein [Vibrio cincinnatiensis]MCG3740935.1 hypothetical protein [Vibrio cincinnatiensis]
MTVNSNTTLRWSLTPVDSWFFREARSHDAVGVGQLKSVFPPPATTLAGAIRTAMGDHLGVDWHEFNTEKGQHHDLLGDGNNLGLLNIQAIQIMVDGKPVYPAPQDLLQEGDSKKLHRLSIGQPVRCDLGYVAMPEMAAPPGSKPLENYWITDEGLQQWLVGGLPDTNHLIAQSELITSESRLGIGRDNATGSVKEGLLYQTRHLRATGNKTFSVDVYLQGISDELADALPAKTSLRLGGEGREAAVHIGKKTTRPELKLPDVVACKKARGVLLYLASPANFNLDSSAQNSPSWCLPGFEAIKNEQGETIHWQGELAGIGLKMVSCVLPRAERLGGWDQKLKKPKPLISLASAGSLYYCELLNPKEQLLTPQLLQHLQQNPVGSDTSLGYGRLLVGLWLD